MTTRRKTSKKRRKAKKPAFVLPVAFTEYGVFFEKKPCKGDDECLAVCNSDKQKIVCGTGMGLNAKRCALWHEFFHAVFYELGWMNDWGNEAKVEALANAVLRVRMNKATRWL